MGEILVIKNVTKECI